jgi:lysophospholipase L1-like esterase
VRRRFDREGRFQESHGVYTGIVREVAAAQKVPLIDMYSKSEKALVGYGAQESRKLFLQLKPGESPNYPKGVEDNTHFNPAGAELMASLAVEGIRERRLGLAKHLLKSRAAKAGGRSEPPEAVK